MSTATDRLQAYLAAERAILSGGQSVQVPGLHGGTTQVTRADLAEIRAEIVQLERQVASEARAARGCGGPRYSQASFRDD
ncbi:hypothetical protein [Methylomagnum ishizawai]|uniref:hypothetical protein n=1 Tax=Methylomagnum ishizawai TaxID=1760988 RepID=UPI001C33CB49|nr:hypothetical protein [Methylomagnum ishizawai]BBL75585.1 hypothetical protein MishRS11D_26830 [Methylomagnum ishizawai]